MIFLCSHLHPLIFSELDICQLLAIMLGLDFIGLFFSMLLCHSWLEISTTCLLHMLPIVCL